MQVYHTMNLAVIVVTIETLLADVNLLWGIKRVFHVVRSVTFISKTPNNQHLYINIKSATKHDIDSMPLIRLSGNYLQSIIYVNRIRTNRYAHGT